MKLSKSLLIFLLMMFSSGLVFSRSGHALEPPGPGEIQTLKETGEFQRRQDFVRSLKNHVFDPNLIENMVNKIEHLKKNAEPGENPLPPPAWQGLPTKGEVKVLAVLISFSDYAFSNSQTDIDSKLFGSGDPGDYPYESLTNYYNRASYTNLDFDGGTTLGWYATAYPRSSVPQTTGGREALLKEVLDYYDTLGHDFSQYDNDGDGDIDYFIVIWTGPNNGWGNFWWGYQTRFTDYSYTLDGKTLTKYSWQWECNPSPGSAGCFKPKVVIHETGHALGLPDYYDYNGDVGPDGGVGGLDMMDANLGDHNCFSKWMLDWITPTFVSSGSQVETLRASGQYEDAVMIFPGADAGDLFSEYFMVQNRHKVNNDDQWFPADGEGMLVWHVDARLNASGSNFQYDNSYTDHKLLRLMEADGLEEIETSNSQADSGDYYAQGNSFGPVTNPDSNCYDGDSSYVSITGISAVGASMSATFSAGAASNEIKVTGNHILINNGDSTPDFENHTRFGKAGVSSGTVMHTFTIANMGNSTLAIGSPGISGAHAADFSITSPPAASLQIGDATTFDVRFDPGAFGDRTAQISFTNNDSDENPFTFTIQGEGDPYCQAPTPDTCCLYITNVDVGGINHSTGAAQTGYADYTDLGPAQVNPGQGITLSVTVFCGTNTSYVTTYIDWNQDYDFDDPGETYIIAESTTNQGPHTVDIDVPAEAATGETRMRVAMRYYASPDACGDFSYGEIEDYTINVTGQPIVSPSVYQLLLLDD